MAKESASASAESDIASALDRVADELQLVREVLDEIRTDFQWAVQDGRIVDRTERAEIHERVQSLTLFNEGDGVELDIDGELTFGEVVSVDDGNNSAVVQLVPSNGTVTVRQDDLSKVDADPIAGHQSVNVARQPIPLPEPGSLF